MSSEQPGAACVPEAAHLGSTVLYRPDGDQRRHQRGVGLSDDSREINRRLRRAASERPNRCKPARALRSPSSRARLAVLRTSGTDTRKAGRPAMAEADQIPEARFTSMRQQHAWDLQRLPNIHRSTFAQEAAPKTTALNTPQRKIQTSQLPRWIFHYAGTSAFRL